jgi:monoamine oxidase
MLSPDDKEIFLEYLRHEGYLTKDLSYKGSHGRGMAVNPGAGLDPGPGKPSDLLGFSDVLNSELWRNFAAVSNHEMQHTMFQPVGGMDQIAKGFERHMGHLIKFHCEVEQIRQADHAVTVNYRDSKTGKRASLTADYMVCTIPLSVLHQLDTDFSDDFKEAIGGVSYALVGKAGLQMKRRFWEEDYGIYGGHVVSVKNGRFGNYQVSLPSTGWESAKGVVLGGYVFGANAAELSALSLKERMDYFVEAGETLFPGDYRANFETGFTWFWHRAKYNLGGWAQWSEEGRKKYYPKLLEPQGRIYLAGEHLSFLTGWQAGAFESAWQKIAKLHQRAVVA